jgi:hypothetical protein
MSAQVDNNTNLCRNPGKESGLMVMLHRLTCEASFTTRAVFFERLAPDFFPALVLLFAIVFVTTTVAGAGCKQPPALSTTWIFVTRL